MPQSNSLVHDQVAGLVEPLTRFDRSSILLRGETHESLAFDIVWGSEVQFTSHLYDGAGGLDSGVRDCGGQSAMQQAAASELAGQQARLGARLQAWAERRAALPLAQEPALLVTDCFSGSRSFGYTYRCGPCGGSGRITCGTCRGGRTVTCGGCFGSGSTTRTEYRSVPSNVAGQYVNVQVEVRSSCGACGGSGRRTCGTCSGSGMVRCSPCAGTGIRNQVVRSDCQVHENYANQLTERREEVRATVQGLNFKQMLQLAAVRRESCQLQAMSVTRSFSAAMALTSTRLLCGPRELSFFGYGHRARIFNFQNVVGVLLTGDLDTLHEALTARGSWMPFRSHARLRTALADMLESEVHQDICDSAEKRAELMKNGTVSPEHSERTLGALRRGLGRLFRAGCAISISLLTAFVLAYEVVVGRFRFHLRLSIGEALVLMVALTIGLGVLVDRLAQRRTLQHFHKQQHGAAEKLLRSTGALRRGRWTVTGAALLAMLLIPVAALTDMALHPPKPSNYVPLIYKNYQPADIQRMAAQVGPGNEVLVEGEVYIRGNLSGIKLHSTRGFVYVAGTVAHSTIVVDKGYLETSQPVTDSTLKAKIIAAGPVTRSDLTCQKCVGKFGPAVQIHQLIWPKSEDSK